jgi:hypothetical protein
MVDTYPCYGKPCDQKSEHIKVPPVIPLTPQSLIMKCMIDPTLVSEAPLLLNKPVLTLWVETTATTVSYLQPPGILSLTVLP